MPSANSDITQVQEFDDDGYHGRDVGARDSTERALHERIKELTCLYNVGRLLDDRDAAPGDVCREVVSLVLPAMQVPLLAVGVITLDGTCFASREDHGDLANSLVSPIYTGGELRGELAVFYTEARPFLLPEEQNLLDNVTRMLGLWLEQRESEAALRATQRQLEELNRELERRIEERTAEVYRSEAIYRALFENSTDGIFLVGPDGNDLLYNQKALELAGYTADEYAALSGTAIIAPEELDDANARLAAVLRGEHVPLYERTFVTKDGKRVDVEINLSPVRDADGKVILAQSIVRDIGERKRAQADLQSSRDQLSVVNAALEEASRLKDEFFASMSHELRSPLTGILGLSEVLQLGSYGALNTRQRDAVDAIASSGRHLLSLINDILDLSKIEAGKLELQIEPFDVEEVCRASLQLVKGMAAQKRIHVEFTCCFDPIRLEADPRRLKQMLVNLLSNAIKFTPERGQVGLVIAQNSDEQAAYLTVWDKGVGIDPADMDKLFRPFVQVDNSLARANAGTGLGLSLVRRMAELHGGSIRVKSTPGEGSRFTIVLPCRTAMPASPAQQQAAESVPQELSVPEPTPEVFLPLVMICDDQVQILDMLADYLTAKSCRVIKVHSGFELLEHASAVRPDVFLIDIQMPGLDGLEVIRRLRAHRDPRLAATPILAVTALVRPGDRERCLAAGANEFISKPVALGHLFEQIVAACASSRSSAAQ